MSTLNDIVDRVTRYAGKTGQEHKKDVRDAVLAVIDTVNSEMDNFTVANRDKTLSVAALAKTVEMPKTCRKIIELGKYDSGTDRISMPYEEISETQFHDEYAGSQTLASMDPINKNKWFLVDDTAGRARVIRLVFPPSLAFTMMARYFEKLTDQNIDRLERHDLLYDGTIGSLGEWFPRSAGLHLQKFERGLATLRATRRSIKRTSRRHVRPDIAAQNQLGAYLTD